MQTSRGVLYRYTYACGKYDSQVCAYKHLYICEQNNVLFVRAYVRLYVALTAALWLTRHDIVFLLPLSRVLLPLNTMHAMRTCKRLKYYAQQHKILI